MLFNITLLISGVIPMSQAHYPGESKLSSEQRQDLIHAIWIAFVLVVVFVVPALKFAWDRSTVSAQSISKLSAQELELALKHKRYRLQSTSIRMYDTEEMLLWQDVYAAQAHIERAEKERLIGEKEYEQNQAIEKSLENSRKNK